MRYVAIAAGFDGTLARDGRCDERCIDALRALSATGRKLILVTGRELRELLEIFPEARLFDYVVAENGAVMHRPATRQSQILAQAPPEILLQELRRRHVTPLTVGSSIVRTVHANEAEVSEALRKLQLDFQLVTNPGALMMLPAGVNKASGVLAALKELGVSRHNLVAIGDGENDLALFEFAEHAVAMQNADPLVKRVANRTTLGAYCDGFLEVTREIIASDLAGATPRHKILLDVDSDGREVDFIPCQDSLVVHGPAGSGKAALCARLLDQLLTLGYQCCILGAEVHGLQTPAQVETFGNLHEAPKLTDILSTLEQPTTSVAINLAALAVETRPVFADALFLQLQALHDRVGRPHVIFMREAQHFLSGVSVASSARLSEISMIYSSSERERLPAQLTSGVTFVVDSATHAIAAGGAAGRISPLPEAGSASGKDSVSEADAATASGY
jgi:hydroxymethylpyrimidine pyrophosphatase-like HAD family hydrolase